LSFLWQRFPNRKTRQSPSSRDSLRHVHDVSESPESQIQVLEGGQETVNDAERIPEDRMSCAANQHWDRLSLGSGQKWKTSHSVSPHVQGVPMLLNKIELIGCRMSRLTCATCNRQNSESKSGDILRMAISG
jgi:hypothetical protein